MILPSKLPESGPAGQAAIARALNSLIDYCKSLTPRSSPTVAVNHTSGGVYYKGSQQQAQAVAAPTAPKVRFHVKSVQADYMTCRMLSGETEVGSDVYVAKDLYSRRSYTHQIIDGIDFTYTYPNTGTIGDDNTRLSTGGGKTQWEVVLPRFSVYSALGAAYVPYGTIEADMISSGTGLSVDGSPVIWKEDTNRVWARRNAQ